jgi:hypothetical protein
MALEDRARLVPFCAGALAVTVACAVVLATQHALGPMIQQMLWTNQNYGTVNQMPYGSRFGGYASLFQDAGIGEKFARGIIVLVISLPAILPPIGLACAWLDRKDRPTRLLAMAGIAFVAATYPRMDVPHLTYAVPIFYVLLAQGACRLKLGGLAKAGVLSISLLAVSFLYYGISLRVNQVVLNTRVGTIRASGDDVGLIEQLDRQIPPGEPFFCFPYLPISYFLTLGENPTRYSYLQPGMMGDADELTVIAELTAHPPYRILYENITEAQILNIWPGTNPAHLKLRRMEDYLTARYRVQSTIYHNGGAFQILERRD